MIWALSANAGQLTQPKAFAQPLHEKIASTISCKDDTSCTVTWTEKAKPNAIEIEQRLLAVRQSLEAELAAIEPKLDDGTATMAEMRRAIKILLLEKKY